MSDERSGHRYGIATVTCWVGGEWIEGEWVSTGIPRRVRSGAVYDLEPEGGPCEENNYGLVGWFDYDDALLYVGGLGGHLEVMSEEELGAPGGDFYLGDPPTGGGGPTEELPF